MKKKKIDPNTVWKIVPDAKTRKNAAFLFSIGKKPTMKSLEGKWRVNMWGIWRFMRWDIKMITSDRLGWNIYGSERRESWFRFIWGTFSMSEQDKEVVLLYRNGSNIVDHLRQCPDDPNMMIGTFNYRLTKKRLIKLAVFTLTRTAMTTEDE